MSEFEKLKDLLFYNIVNANPYHEIDILEVCWCEVRVRIVEIGDNRLNIKIEYGNGKRKIMANKDFDTAVETYKYMLTAFKLPIDEGVLK